MANSDVSVEDELRELMMAFYNDESGLSPILEYVSKKEHEAELRGQRSIAIGTLEDEIRYHRNTMKECKDLIKKLTAPTTDDTATDGGE